MVTVAPELGGADDLIRAAVAAGVLVAVGHTNADRDTVRRAFDLGARHVTHLFNAMAGLHHRDPGLEAEATVLEGRVVHDPTGLLRSAA